MTTDPAITAFVAAVLVLVAWVAYERLAASKCATCPRGFALHRRGTFYLCRVCARLYEYAAADLKRESRRAIDEGLRARAIRHNKPTAKPVETTLHTLWTRFAKVFRPRGARPRGNAGPPGGVK